MGAQGRIRVDGVRDVDRAEQRQVVLRIRIEVTGFGGPALLALPGVQRCDLAFPIGEDALGEASVATVYHLHVGAQRVLDVQLRADGFDQEALRGGDHQDLVTGFAMALQALQRLGIEQRRDHLDREPISQRPAFGGRATGQRLQGEGQVVFQRQLALGIQPYHRLLARHELFQIQPACAPR